MLEILLAVYLSGLAIAMWKLWYPAYKEIKSIAPNALVARYPFAMFFTVLFMFAVAWPLVMWIALQDDYSREFKESFINGAVTKNERR